MMLNLNEQKQKSEEGVNHYIATPRKNSIYLNVLCASIMFKCLS